MSLSNKFKDDYISVILLYASCSTLFTLPINFIIIIEIKCFYIPALFIVLRGDRHVRALQLDSCNSTGFIVS